jgi:hypothetical protein
MAQNAQHKPDDAVKRFGLPAVVGLAVAFVAAAVWWFIATATGSGSLKVGSAFAGLGYLAAVVGLAVAIVLLAWLLTGALQRRNRGPAPARRRSASDEHAIVRTQLVLGAGLVLAGAVVGLICLCFIHPSDAVASPILALATAVIGAGATLLPAGAAGSANARLAAQGGASAAGADGTAPVATMFPGFTEKRKLLGSVDPKGHTGFVRFQYGGTDAKDSEPLVTNTAGQVALQPGAIQRVEAMLESVGTEPRIGVRLVGETADGQRFSSDWVYFDAH